LAPFQKPAGYLVAAKPPPSEGSEASLKLLPVAPLPIIIR
jgi:hypothetical protein